MVSLMMLLALGEQFTTAQVPMPCGAVGHPCYVRSAEPLDVKVYTVESADGGSNVVEIAGAFSALHEQFKSSSILVARVTLSLAPKSHLFTSLQCVCCNEPCFFNT